MIIIKFLTLLSGNYLAWHNKCIFGKLPIDTKNMSKKNHCRSRAYATWIQNAQSYYQYIRLYLKGTWLIWINMIQLLTSLIDSVHWLTWLSMLLIMLSMTMAASGHRSACLSLAAMDTGLLAGTPKITVHTLSRFN